jgi:hypothetical protein
MWKQYLRFKNRCLLMTGILSVTMVLVGCGGNSGRTSNPSPTPSSGSSATPAPTPTPTSSPGIPQNRGLARLRIDWPSLVPGSIVGSLVSSTGSVIIASFTRNRPADTNAITETVDFPEEIPPGMYVFSFETYTLANGKGTRITSGSQSVTINTGETTNITIALTNTPRAYYITLSHDVIRVGETIPLVLQGWLGNGNALNISPAEVQWSLIRGSESALVVPSGNAGESALKAIAPGTVEVQALESGHTVERLVQVLDVAGLKIRASDADSVFSSELRVQLAAVYEDSRGNSLSYAPGKLVWSIVSGQSVATVDSATGLLTPLGGEGVVRVGVMDSRFGFSAEHEFTIQAYGNGVDIDVR